MPDVAEQGYPEAADAGGASAAPPGGSSYAVWRSAVPRSRYPVPIATGLAAPDFVDTSGIPGATYYYTMTRTAADGTTEATPEVPAVFPALPATPHAKDTMSTLVFSTGTLFIDTGAGPVEMMTLQSIEFSQAWQEKELRAAPWINMFAEARAFYGGKVELKASYATILASGLAAVTAGLNTPAAPANPAAAPPTPAVPGLLTVGKKAILPAMHAQFTGQDEFGNPFTATAQKVHAPGVTLKMALDNYTMPDVTFVADEDANGNVLTWQFTV